MRFKAKQLSDNTRFPGKWAVFKNGTSFWTHTVSDTKAEAEEHARHRTALWHIDKAREALEGMSDIQLVKEVGWDADWRLTSKVEEILKDNDGDFDPMDPRSFLA